MSRANETRFIEWHEKCKCKLDQMQLFVIINSVGIKINVDVNLKNLLIKEYVIKDLFEIPVVVSVNVIKLVMSVIIWTIKIVNAEKNQLIN